MVSVKETFNKIYENKHIHWWLFLFILIGAILSSIFNIAIGKPDSNKQNIIDSIFGIFLSACSIQFLHNILHGENNGEISLFNKIKPSVYLKIIIVKIIWGIMITISLIPFAIILYILLSAILTGASKGIFIACSVVLILSLLSAFFPYINITLADTMKIGESVNPMILFRAIRLTAGKTYTQFFKYIGISILFIVIFICAYAGVELSKLNSLLQITKGFQIPEIIMYSIVWYVMFIIWSLMYPYSLLETYRENVAPAKEELYENN